MDRAARLAPLFVVGLTLVACGGTPSPGSDAGDAAGADAAQDVARRDGTPGPDGAGPTMVDGRVLFRGLGEGVAWAVEFYAAPVAAPRYIARGDGHCEVHPTGGGDGFIELPAAGTLDLGATVTATSGTQTLTQPVDPSDGTFSYVFTRAGINAFGMDWTLANAGSPTGLAATTLATVQVPTAVAPIVPAPMGGTVDTTNGPLTLRWTGGSGAQSFHIQISAPSIDVDCYPSPTATEFTLPADLVAMLPSSVTPVLWAETVTVVTVGARTLWVRVTSDNLD